MNLKTVLGQFRILAVLEGISYLLLALTMPLKYYYDMGMPNKIVGMAHGVLFIMYCIWLIAFAKKADWNMIKTMVGFVASLFPFGTFIFDAKILAKEEA